jgi:hypothetical protein
MLLDEAEQIWNLDHKKKGQTKTPNILSAHKISSWSAL